MDKIVLIGGGGHCKVVIDAIRKAALYSIYGIVDADAAKKEVLNIPVVGNDDSLKAIYNSGVKNAFITLGSVGNTTPRIKLYNLIRAIGFNLPAIIHKNSVIAEDVRIEEGAFIAAGAVINTGSSIGKNAIINTSSSIDHDCRIGGFVHVAPGATLSGGITIGERTHIGTGSNIVQYLNIGKDCFVKAGTLISNDVPDGYIIDNESMRKGPAKDEK